MSGDATPVIEDLPDEVRAFLEEHQANEPGNRWTLAWLIVWCVREIMKLKVGMRNGSAS